GATHQLPPTQQEVAKRVARVQPLDVVGRRQGGQRPIARGDAIRVVADAGKRCLQRRQLVPRHRRAQAQLAGGQPARRPYRRVVADRHAVARQLRPHLIVLRREPGAAQLDSTAAQRGRVAAPADAVARLEYRHGDARLSQITRRPQPCQAGPGHDHAAVAHGANLPERLWSVAMSSGSDTHAGAAAFVKEHRLPGASVAVVHGDDLAWSAGIGLCDAAAGRTADDTTLYRVASVTKTFTGTAIMQLRDEGRLGLDDPVVAHVPELSAAVGVSPIESVTIRRLLS